MEQAPKRGRPPKFAPGERTRGPLTIRLRDQVREELETAAAAAGRSLSEEVEYRLELSFNRRDYLRETWGDDFFDLADAAAKSLTHIQHFTGKSWVKDDRTGDLLVMTLAELVRRYRENAALAEMMGTTPFEEMGRQSDPKLVDTFATLGGLRGAERSPPAPGTFAEAKTLEREAKRSAHHAASGIAKSDTNEKAGDE